MMAMRKFFLKISFFLPILALLVIVNWRYDPAYLFSRAGDGSEEKIVQSQLAGKNVEIVNANFDMRLLQKLYIEQLAKPPDILVLGSSESQTINSSLFPGRSFYNANVNAATLEDYLGIYELFYERGLIPKTVIVEVDPWVLKRKSETVRWGTLSDQVRHALKRLQVGYEELSSAQRYSEIRKYGELFSPSYFQVSISLLFMVNQHIPTNSRETELNQAEFTIRFPDGSVELSSRQRGITREHLREVAIDFGNRKSVQSLGGFSGIDPFYEKLFGLFIRDMKSHGVNVVFYLPSYHPAAYEVIINNANRELLLAVRDYVDKLATELDIPIVGSYNPADIGLDAADFVDGNHTRREAMAKIFGGLEEEGLP